MSEIKIIIDKEILEKYNLYYFDKYPRRKKIPIERVIAPSLNYFTSIKRMVQHSLKKNYKEFSNWIAFYYKINDLRLEKAVITYTFFFADHRRRDFDNMCLTAKFFNDGFVDAKTLVDDDGLHLMIRFNKFEFDKNHPRTEMVIEY